MKTHRFTLDVKTCGSRKWAEGAVLIAFSGRKPDGCEFHLGGVPKAKTETDIQKLSGGLAGIARLLGETGMGSVKLGVIAKHMLKLRKKKATK